MLGAQVLQLTEFEFMGDQGEFFVDFVGQYGYDRVLSVLGRHMRDFLNGPRPFFCSCRVCYRTLKIMSGPEEESVPTKVDSVGLS